MEDSSFPSRESAGLLPGPSEPEWKQRLRDRFESILADLEDPPEGLPLGDVEESPESEELVDEPDLYSFYEALTVLRNEFRRGNRRTAETFSQFGDSLGGLEGEIGNLRRQLQTIGEQSGAPEALPRSHALALLDVSDRVRRLEEALENPPASKKSFWRRPADAWPQAWAELRQAVEMLQHHLAALLARLGLEPISVIGQPFDPTLMKGVARERKNGVAPNTVLEELSRGYLYQGEPLRLAEVKVSAAPAGETHSTDQANP